MRFLVRLSNPGKYQPADRKRLTQEAYERVRVFKADVGNLRVSSSAVELDLLLDSKSILEKAVEALAREIGPVLTIRQLDVESAPIGDAQTIKLGLDLFNEERYWESHEALETAWRRMTGAEKDILQGIILLAAALVHLQKNEQSIALSVIGRAHQRLSPYDGGHFGIDLSVLKTKVEGMLSAGEPQFFKVETKD